MPNHAGNLQGPCHKLRWAGKLKALSSRPSLLRNPSVKSISNNTGFQVYDRDAITTALRRSREDPITRLPLADTTLTPVFVLRSKAQEYRVGAARACIEEACKLSCSWPAALLRRAVELTGCRDEGDGEREGGISVRGLSRECCSFVLDHPESSQDSTALQHLAASLEAAGLWDEASNILLHCLLALRRAGDARAEQVAVLACCIACWEAAALQGSEKVQRGSYLLTDTNLGKLAGLVEQQHAYSWTEVCTSTSSCFASARQ